MDKWIQINNVLFFFVKSGLQILYCTVILAHGRYLLMRRLENNDTPNISNISFVCTKVLYFIIFILIFFLYEIMHPLFSLKYFIFCNRGINSEAYPLFSLFFFCNITYLL